MRDSVWWVEPAIDVPGIPCLHCFKATGYAEHCEPSKGLIRV
jgi:hypothetical protein